MRCGLKAPLLLPGSPRAADAVPSASTSCLRTVRVRPSRPTLTASRIHATGSWPNVKPSALRIALASAEVLWPQTLCALFGQILSFCICPLVQQSDTRQRYHSNLKQHQIASPQQPKRHQMASTQYLQIALLLQLLFQIQQLLRRHSRITLRIFRHFMHCRNRHQRAEETRFAFHQIQISQRA